MKRTTLTTIISFLALGLFAQSYNTVGGMRLGTDWGLTVKQRVYDNYTAELLIQSSLLREEVMLTFLANRHYNIFTRHLNLYLGGGFHKGWIGEEQLDEEAVPARDPFGVDVLFGIETTLGNLNLSYDIKPAINLVGGEKLIYTQTGISLRYRFWKREKFQWEKSKKRRERERRRKQRRRNKR